MAGSQKHVGPYSDNSKSSIVAAINSLACSQSRDYGEGAIAVIGACITRTSVSAILVFCWCGCSAGVAALQPRAMDLHSVTL
jgi:hypothetical protein